MKKGALIVFEGIDGTGKATQARLLARRLRASGRVVTMFSFPDYSRPVGQFIHDALHGKYGDFRKTNTYFTSIPYSLDRGIALAKIQKALKKGVVICDRYTTSGIAFGSANLPAARRAEFRRFFEELEYELLRLPKPDTVLYLDTSPVLTKQRLQSEKGKKLDANERDTKFQHTVAEVYRQLSKGKNWHRIVCKPVDSAKEVHERVWDVLHKA